MITPSDDVRRRLAALYDEARPQIEAFATYAQNAAALNMELHKARLAELFPAAPVQEMAVLLVLDARETPASLDAHLSQIQLSGRTPKAIVFDLTKNQFILYV